MSPSQTPVQRPAAVVFDIGKVLLDFDYGIAARALSRQSRLTAQAFREVIDQTPLLHRYESGGMATADFVAAVRDRTGFAGSTGDFELTFGAIFSPIESMVALHRDVRRAGFRAFILSNTNELAVANMRRNFHFFADFDGYVFSHEAGAMKPDPRIYAAVEKLSGNAGAELLLIDDRPENVAGARARGWQAIEHTDPAATRAAVESAIRAA